MRFVPYSAAAAFVLTALAALISGGTARADNPPGVTGDGVTDVTAALQAALDQTGHTGGEVVLSPGRYLVKGSLTVPTGVALRGSWDAPHHGAWDRGTTLLLTGGRGQEDGPAAITLQQSAAVRGLTLVWPEETADHIVPYPWAIHGYGMHNTVEDITLVNAYQGIKIGQPGSELHLIRNVFGCVLRRGIFIDSTTDVGRIENVHFNTHYWMRSGYPSILLANGATGSLVTGFTEKNLEAFLFGRSDWEYVANTFVWGAHIGYHFIKTRDGACNGQFMGIGADACAAGVLIDQMQGIGIQVTNGEFTSFIGEPNAGIVVAQGATGGAQFVNCNFWATPGGAAQIHGNTQVSFSACRFVEGAANGVIQAENGHLSVTGCTFGAKGRAIVLKSGTLGAVVTGNLQSGGLEVENGIGATAQIGLNEVARVLPAAATSHYHLKIGVAGDEEFLGDGWFGGEDADDADPKDSGSRTARWTSGDATLRLPVTPGAAYTLTVWLLTRPHTPPETITAGGVTRPIAVGQRQRLTLAIPASATKGRHTIDVRIAGRAWSPSALFPGSTDSRKLGVRVFALEMKTTARPPVSITEKRRGGKTVRQQTTTR